MIYLKIFTIIYNNILHFIKDLKEKFQSYSRRRDAWKDSILFTEKSCMKSLNLIHREELHEKTPSYLRRWVAWKDMKEDA